MDELTFYHHVGTEKYEGIARSGMLMPSAPFNPSIQEDEWSNYAHQFSFPVARLNTCCFFEPEPKSWKDYGLFDLLMEEFAGGDYLLELRVEDKKDLPILVRDHGFHSPKVYGKSPQEWRKRDVRNSRPDLRNAWHQSTTLLRDYDGDFICPELLIPFPISLNKIRVINK